MRKREKLWLGIKGKMKKVPKKKKRSKIGIMFTIRKGKHNHRNAKWQSIREERKK